MERESHLTMLSRIHTYLRPRTYVEIGVAEGKSLTLVPPGVRAVAIDPEPRISFRVGRARVFRMTSDAFFAEHDLTAILGRPIDLAFIDGMHLFEFALRDFANLEAHCTPNSVILIDDCYPIDRESAERERKTPAWTGDVWKLIPCLKEFRPDLHLAVASVPRTGLGIVSNLDPNSTVLRLRYQEMCDRFIQMPYESLAVDKARILNRTGGDWPSVRSLLPPEPFQQLNDRKVLRRRHGTARLRYRVYVKRFLARSPLGSLLRRLRSGRQTRSSRKLDP